MTTHDRLLGAFTLFAGATVGIAACFVGLGGLPFNAADLRRPVHRRGVEFALPQGWAFFTRDPREARRFAYQKKADHWVMALMLPHSRAGNMFGLNRQGRAHAGEMERIMGLVGPNQWTACRGTVAACADSTGRPQRVDNPTSHPTLCGELLLMERPPVPWAWSAAAATTIMPGRVALVFVAC